MTPSRLFLLAMLAAACSAATLKICVLEFANVDDLGWTFSVNVGRLTTKTRLEAMFSGLTVDTLAFPNCQFAYPTPAAKAGLLQTLMNEKCNVVISIGAGYLVTQTLLNNQALAQKYTNVSWLKL